MKGFVGIGRADHVETAITEATAGLKKADFLILIAPFSKIEAAAALLGEKYPGTPMIGTSGEGIAKEMRLTQAIIVIGFAGIEVCTGIIEDVRTTPVKSMHTFLANLQAIEPGDSDTICLEFMTRLRGTCPVNRPRFPAGSRCSVDRCQCLWRPAR